MCELLNVPLCTCRVRNCNSSFFAVHYYCKAPERRRERVILPRSTVWINFGVAAATTIRRPPRFGGHHDACSRDDNQRARLGGRVPHRRIRGADRAGRNLCRLGRRRRRILGGASRVHAAVRSRIAARGGHDAAPSARFDGRDAELAARRDASAGGATQNDAPRPRLSAARALLLGALHRASLFDAALADRMREFISWHIEASERISIPLHKQRATVWNRIRWNLSWLLVSVIDYTVTRRLNLGI